MAKVKYGAMINDARGKMDGVVYSKNQYGAYVRQKVSPVQPQTARQTLVRERLSSLSKTFSTVLTAAQQLAWNAFGKLNPVVDVFGDSQTLSGVAAFVRLNSVILNAGGAQITSPPANLEVIGLLTASAVAGAGAGTLAITYTATPLGAGSRLYIYATPGMNPGVQFFKPALRFIGSSALAQASPFAAGALYTAKFGAMTATKVIGITVAIVDEVKGALSPGVFLRIIIGA